MPTVLIAFVHCPPSTADCIAARDLALFDMEGVNLSKREQRLLVALAKSLVKIADEGDEGSQDIDEEHQLEK